MSFFHQRISFFFEKKVFYHFLFSSEKKQIHFSELKLVQEAEVVIGMSASVSADTGRKL